MIAAIIAFSVILVILLVILIANIKIVPQAHAYVIERLGSYRETWSNGLHMKVPFIERISKRVNLMEQVVDFPPQSVITKDNVRMQIDTVVYYQITDCKLYAYGVTNPIFAIENLTATTLRNMIGELDLDGTLTSRDTINTKMRAILDQATDAWGIKVNRVELKNIIPPREIQDAMEKQMKAERERRESILRAEGEKNSAILVAEGRKQSAILEAEAEKQAAILRAEAQREARIREAFRTDLADTTKLIIAQRIGSVKDADRIIVMNEGRITGVGTHAELLAGNTEYQEIFESQMDKKEEEGKDDGSKNA